MDYARIYSEFIADRRERQEPAGYSEVHHILPRSLGGGDEAENLIRLTPEDHYFAHLLIAKMHGGTQWTAVVMMGTSRRDGERRWVRQRYMYGAARRRSAERLSELNSGQPGKRGADNGMHDPSEADWVNVDTGETRTATKWAMWSEFGGCRAHWTSAVNGNRKTTMGWTPHPSAVRVRSSKGKSFEFANDNGERFAGTQGEFASRFGFSVATASRIARGAQVSRCGWRVNEKKAV